MAGVFSKIFGTYSDHQIKKLTPTVNAIEALAPKMAAMTDAEMLAMTDKFKARLAAGETLDDILPEAYALVREAADRVLGKRPFRVQLMCGIVLHQGRIAEMKTGEGKTLVAVLPAYLNALEGKGVHIVTVNEYLAKIGCEEMGRVHEFLGLTTGLVLADQTTEEKQKAYNCDITYGTNNEMGFDYLRDNMATYKERCVQRGFNFAIVDEVDSILIDESRTPLIISGHGDKANELYEKADDLVKTFSKYVIKELDTKTDYDDVTQDYIVDEKARNATLTASGIRKAEQFFGIENFSSPENSAISHHVYQAIKAHGVMKRDVDYIVKDDEVFIVDTFTGRVMPGRRYSDGLHQAIEAKERVAIKKENRTIATITLQNYFRMYTKLSGMTGTALTEEEEFREIYALDCVEIPTNKPMIRVDHPDIIFKTVKEKDEAVIEQIKECHEKGQPVLVGTVSIDKSEALSKKLRAAGIPHTVLNAKHHEKEAEIVAQAGKLGAVTISTNMAGRGTDIMLGGNAEYLAKSEMRRLDYDEEMIALATGSSQSVSEEVMEARKFFHSLYDKYRDEIKPLAEKVCEAGGLYVIGTERHESRRIDNQLRGRSGRQGDPGESKFFVSFEDDLMRIFGGDRALSILNRFNLEEGQPVDEKLMSPYIEKAQKQIEGRHFNARKNVLQYDDVMNEQRKLIYSQRNEVLSGTDLREKIVGMINDTVDEAVSAFLHEDDVAAWDLDGLKSKYMNLLVTPEDFTDLDSSSPSAAREKIRETLLKRAMTLYENKEEVVFGKERMREIERALLLRNVDIKWMDHLEAMDSLMESIGLQAYAQRNPISEYRIYGGDLFAQMVDEIRDDTVRDILSVVPKEKAEERKQVYKIAGTTGGDGTLKKKPVVNKEAKVGRNDPCPCGSGKKYKKCCGA